MELNRLVTSARTENGLIASALPLSKEMYKIIHGTAYLDKHLNNYAKDRLADEIARTAYGKIDSSNIDKVEVIKQVMTEFKIEEGDLQEFETEKGETVVNFIVFNTYSVKIN